MLRSIQQFYGLSLGASDGFIGQVKDFYFDDGNWTIRYVVVDTSGWLPGRLVLIAPHAFTSLAQIDKKLSVKLTRKQIEASPAIDSHKPVSRQYEEEYYRHFGLPFYWQGDGLWGASAFPILEEPAKTYPDGPSKALGSHPKGADAHLRSTQSVKGYHLQASDGINGHVDDFMMDEQSWAIRQFVVKTGHRLSGREVLIPSREVTRISYPESTVFVNLTKEAVDQCDCPADLEPHEAMTLPVSPIVL